MTSINAYTSGHGPDYEWRPYNAYTSGHGPDYEWRPYNAYASGHGPDYEWRPYNAYASGHSPDYERRPYNKTTRNVMRSTFLNITLRPEGTLKHLDKFYTSCMKSEKVFINWYFLWKSLERICASICGYATPYF